MPPRPNSCSSIPIPEQTPLTISSCIDVATSKSTETDKHEPPRKRRKVTAKDRATQSDEERWDDHLTLSRVEVELVFASDRESPTVGPCSGTVSDSAAVQLRQPVISHDGGYQCALYNADGRSLGSYKLQSGMPPETLRVLQAAGSLKPYNKRSSAKAVCEVRRRGQLREGVTYTLHVEVLWRNSKSFDDMRSDGQNDIMVLVAPGEGHYKPEPWSPRVFYDSMHVLPRDGKPADLDINGLACQLYPFQKRAISWLRFREGLGTQGDGVNNNDTISAGDGLPHGFFRTADADGRECFVSHWLGIATTHKSLLKTVKSQLQGGILAEEMGLGKTVELIALISSHRRPSSLERCQGADQNLAPSSATLIISPPSILQQWISEIKDHAPYLRVMVYDGIRATDRDASDEEMLTRLLDHDIVLTTYGTLASEIHYSSATPQRNLRHEKKYERRKSPLVRIDWWRVVLDECQMVESGVSHAAKVAQLIPRRNAWAVSGTPLKRDAADLLGLLIFLRLEPYCLSTTSWSRMVLNYQPIFRILFGTIALRHTKELVRGEIQLPPQKRVVLSIPFTQIEEQHYSTLYQQMCEECGFDKEGQPLNDSWNADSAGVVEKMRTWLTRLRQTCLHPEVGDRNRRALGHNHGPLRTVGEVLQVMIEQNDMASRTEERTFLLSKLRRGQLLEHANRSEDALAIWREVLEHVKVTVNDSRQDLRSGELLSKASNSDNHLEADGATGRQLIRLRLRSALELEHIATFFIANAYFQIKSDSKMTPVDSESFKELEKLENETYEKAKELRKEMLAETQGRADSFMDVVSMKASKQEFVKIPNIKLEFSPGGIESRNIMERLDELCESINRQAEILDEWREKMVELLLLPLVDQEETELQGDEYENSTKQQDEVYVYMEALRAAVADRHDALTGQTNILIRGEMTTALQQAIRGEGHSPELMQRLLKLRTRVKPGEKLGSIRSIITELRAIKTTLRGQEERGNSRAIAEIGILNKALESLQLDITAQSKAVVGLEREVEMFRDTMNARLEYYRQLQTISDAVAPYEEESNEDALTAAIVKLKETEVRLQEKTATLKARGRYLIHLRAESTTEDVQRKCIICQDHFEIGALTSCGHSYCKECLRLWWNVHRNCPTCKKHLSRNDLFQITYKPQEMTVHEEAQSITSDSDSDSATSSIYSGINSLTLNQIKNIDVEGSFGSKIDTLARHILWIRENDPGAKSVIFSQYKDFLDVLSRAFSTFKIGFASIEKKNGVEKFKKDPSIECFFLHAKAQSSGLNLVNATHVFLCEPLINTALELQAIARVHRIGQYQPTTVWMYLVEDTVEKAIYDISVTRRLAHIGRSADSGGTVNLDEDEIEAANSLALQDAPLSKLLTKGSGGGEMVDKKDLWNCLFRQRVASRGPVVPEEAEREATKFLGATAAEERRGLAKER
ncbi:hypothetical protein MMC26_001341 [Xylographa opegraphella]|nr:hypothetical protein [Xylographa opegraphella]